jgi:hypothetical protein
MKQVDTISRKPSFQMIIQSYVEEQEEIKEKAMPK